MTQTPNQYLWFELQEYKSALGALLFFSAIIAILSFLPVIYMHQLMERVMVSRSLATLATLAAIVAFLSAVRALIEIARQRALQRIANALDEKISARVFDALNRQTDKLDHAGRAAILNDLNVIRDIICSSLVIQAMDLCFVPLIILGTVFIHPLIALSLVIIAACMVALALLSQLAARDDIRRSVIAGNAATEFGRSVMQNAESLRALGMLPAVVRLWRDRQRQAIGWQYGAMLRSEKFAHALRYLRLMTVPALLTVGGILFVAEMASAGVVLAVVLLVRRVITPVDTIAGSWRAFWNATLSAGRIDLLLREAAARGEKVELPAPAGPFIVSRIAVAPPNRDAAVLTDVSFSARPGQVVAVVGASGAGKSTLARALIGAWPIRRGSITLDGNELSHWDQDQLGRYIGYVAQDVDLLPGTVAANISRFDESGADTNRKLIEAVKLAGVQDIIGKLPDGLNTLLGPAGHTLSSGQRQRIALARAVYGLPRLVVLDEPNSNLDSAGEQQLAQTITKLRDSGAIVILVTHRMNMLTYCDNVLVINAGTVQAYGAKDHVIERLSSYRPKELTDNRPRPDRPEAAE